MCWVACLHPTCVIVGWPIVSGDVRWLPWESLNIPRQISEMAIEMNFTLHNMGPTSGVIINKEFLFCCLYRFQTHKPLWILIITRVLKADLYLHIPQIRSFTTKYPKSDIITFQTLQEHKPPPRLDRNLDHHQNLISCPFYHPGPSINCHCNPFLIFL